MSQQQSKRPVINLTTVTDQSSISAINNNFRKLQDELSSLNLYLEPIAQSGKAAKDLMDQYLGPLPPISKQEAIRYTEEQIKEAEEEILDELSSRIGDVSEQIKDLQDISGELHTRVDEVDSLLDEHGGKISSIETDIDGVEGKLTTTITNVESIGDTVHSNTTELAAHAEAIEAKLNSLDYERDRDGIVTRIEENETEIRATAEGLEFRITKEEFDAEVGDLTDRVSETETTITTHAGQIQAKAEKTEVYTRTEMDSALGEKVDTTVYSNKVGELTTSIEGISGRVSNTESSIDTITGEIGSAVSQIAEIDAKADGIVQSVSEIVADLTDVGNRVSTAEGSISTIAGIVELKASQTEVDGIEGRMSEAEASISVLPGQIEARVEKDGVIGAINASPEQLLISFDKVKMTGELEAYHIKSLAGLNINNQFIVDSNGQVKLANDKVTIDRLGVKVKEADFLVEDAQTGLVSKIVPMTNLIFDHSFEMIEGGNMLPDNSYSIDHSPYWDLVGSPRAVETEFGHDGAPIAMFGDQAVIVNNSNYVVDRNASWYIWPGDTYTLSSFFVRSRKGDAGIGQPVFHIKLFEYDVINGRDVLLWEKREVFPTVPSNYDVVRHSTTFTIPEIEWKDPGTWVEIIVTTTGSHWVEVDGVQLVRGSYPTIYDSEDSLWRSFTGWGYPTKKLDIGHLKLSGNNPFSAANEVLDLGLRYKIFTDGDGPGTDNSRLWLDAPHGGAMYFGPRGGSSLLSQVFFRSHDLTIATGGGIGGSSDGRIRFKQSNSNYIMLTTDGSAHFYANGIIRHALNASGNKSGGSFEFDDGVVLGMSPTDSPQTLIEYIEFDVPLNENGVKIYLDSRYREAVANFVVFPNNGIVVEKGYDYFVIVGNGLADIVIKGERSGLEGTFWDDMNAYMDEEDGNGPSPIETI